MSVGGVRIEDDILVTHDGRENLTTAPKGEEMLQIILGSLPPALEPRPGRSLPIRSESDRRRQRRPARCSRKSKSASEQVRSSNTRSTCTSANLRTSSASKCLRVANSRTRSSKTSPKSATKSCHNSTISWPTSWPHMRGKRRRFHRAASPW